MKKVLTIGCIAGFFAFMCYAFSFAFEPVWLGSHTATADTTQVLCLSHTFLVGTSTITENGRGILHAVCINQGNQGTVTVYNSSSTAVNPVAVLLSTTAATAGCFTYDIGMSSGIVYSDTAANDVTFTYSCY
jgi:hypothetical protein